MRTFYLSFASETGFLGGCVVDISLEEIEEAKKLIAMKFPKALPDAHLIGAAIQKAHQLGCNPGGEVMGVDVTGAPCPFPKGVLLSRAEMERLDPTEKVH